MPRLLLECTNVFRNPQVNTGIQRVVRNIVCQLEYANQDIECTPVVLAGDRLYRVRRLLPGAEDQTLLSRLFTRLEQINHRAWQIYALAEGYWPMRRFHNARRVLFVLWRLLCLPMSLSIRVLRLLGYDPLHRRAEPLEVQSGDSLILLDSSWHASHFPLIRRLKSQGVTIVAVVHDLIPLIRPEFSEARLREIFLAWFDFMVEQADGFVAVSRTVREHVRQELTRRLGESSAAQRWYGFFHHGSELDLAHSEASPAEELAKLFSAGNVYLAVGTIEPRKNHEYLLDAFELAWSAGSEARLCIIGRIGWKREALLKRLREHPQLGSRLFVLNGVTDTGLEYAYKQAKALVFSSHDEGFGLPLVEAMQRGLPVMGSDIPVFHEIGGDYMAYFCLQQPQQLAELVSCFEREGRFPAPRTLEDWSWNSWREACQQLIKTVLTQGRSDKACETNAHST